MANLSPEGPVVDLAEHIGAIISLLGVFAGIAAMLLWRMLVRVEKKVDDIGTWILGFTKSCADCKQNFLSVDAFNEWKLEHMQMFKEWKRGRDGPGGLWEAINKLRERMKI